MNDSSPGTKVLPPLPVKLLSMNSDKNKKIEEILGSLDNCQRAAAPDFFYTRLKARMLAAEEKNMGVPVKRPLILRPVFALTSLAAVLIINAFVIFQRDNNSLPDDTALSDTETLQSIAAEYRLNDNSTVLFDINQDK